MPKNSKSSNHEQHSLKDAGLKITTPRLKILQTLESSVSKHLSAEDIYAALRTEQAIDISLATIYRVLTQFVRAGLIIKHNFDNNGSVFELDNGEHHDHMLCQQCEKVIEFHDDTIEARQDSVAEQFGFTITSHSLQLYGICNECNATN